MLIALFVATFHVRYNAQKLPSILLQYSEIAAICALQTDVKNIFEVKEKPNLFHI